MKELFYLLLRYWNQKDQLRHSFNYAVLNNGKVATCAFCNHGSVALGQVTLGKFIFQVPVCEDHHRRYMDAHFTSWRVMMPHQFIMNPKFKTT